MLIGTFGIDSESSPQLPSTTTFRFLNQKKRKFRYFGPTRGLWCLIISKWKSVWTFEFSQLHSQFEYNSKGYVMLDHFKVKISPNIWIFTTDTRPQIASLSSPHPTSISVLWRKYVRNHAGFLASFRERKKTRFHRQLQLYLVSRSASTPASHANSMARFLQVSTKGAL